MKNFIAQGDSLTLTAPAGGVTSGEPVVVGGLLVVPKHKAAEGEQFTALWRGEFKFSKVAADTPAQLAKAYWKADTKEFTTTASGNKLVGVFSESGIADQVEINVLLTGAAI